MQYYNSFTKRWIQGLKGIAYMFLAHEFMRNLNYNYITYK